MNTEMLDIGTRRELFVDRHLVGRLDGARPVLYHPQPQQVAITCDAPWEGSGPGYPTVFHDGGLYRLYYRVSPAAACAWKSRTNRDRRFLVRIRYADGLTVYVRHDPDEPGQQDNMRTLEKLHGLRAPSNIPSYAAPVSTDFWEDSEEPEVFARWWTETESGPAWEQLRP